MISSALKPRRVAAAAVAALAIATAWSVGPGAVPTAAAAGVCPGQQVSQVFLPWLDPAGYTLVGDGGFESGAKGWTLEGGASVVSGNEPWKVHGAGDGRALNLPAGAKATSPAACIGLLHPTTRFFARSLGGLLRVDATLTLGRLSLSLPIGVVPAGGSFAPTSPLPLLANLTTLLTGGSGSVTLTFTAIGGPVQIDDVYIDPFKVH